MLNLLGESTVSQTLIQVISFAAIIFFGALVLVCLLDLLLYIFDNSKRGIIFNRNASEIEQPQYVEKKVKEPKEKKSSKKDQDDEFTVIYNPDIFFKDEQEKEEEKQEDLGFDPELAAKEQADLESRFVKEDFSEDESVFNDDEMNNLSNNSLDLNVILDDVVNQVKKDNMSTKKKFSFVDDYEDELDQPQEVIEQFTTNVDETPVVDEEKEEMKQKIAELEQMRLQDRQEFFEKLQELSTKQDQVNVEVEQENLKLKEQLEQSIQESQAEQVAEFINSIDTDHDTDVIVNIKNDAETLPEILEINEDKKEQEVEEQAKVEQVIIIKAKPMHDKEYYIEKLENLEKDLKDYEKELKVTNKEFKPLERVHKSYDRDVQKLRRKEAILAKQKVNIYGVNNLSNIPDDKKEKLQEDIKLFKELKESVQHCAEVIEKSKTRYPILKKNNTLLTKQIFRLKQDIKDVQTTLEWFDNDNK